MAGGAAASEGSATIRVARGARAVEAALLAEIAASVEEGRRDPAALALPLRVVVPSRSLRQHLAAELLRASGRSLAGVEIQTLHGLALGVLERAGEPPPPGAALYPVLVRQLARREPALRDRLDALEDGYGCVEVSVSDLLDAGFDASHLEGVEELLTEAGPGDAAARFAAVARVAARAAREIAAGRAGHRSQLLRRARERIEAEPDRLLPTRALFVHGFADATGLQTDLIEALIRHCGARVFLSRPPDPADPDAVDPGAAFGERFAERLARAADLEEVAGEGMEAPDLTVLHAPGPQAEIRAVALRLRALLDRGAEPERLAVVARQLGSYRLGLRLHLTRLGVPFSGCGGRGPSGPAGRRIAALLTLLRDRERAPAERWLEALERLGGDGADPGRGLSIGERADLRLAFHARGAGRVGEVAGLAAAREAGGAGEIPIPARSGLRLPEEGGDPVAPRRTLSRERFAAAIGAARRLCGRLAEWPERDRIAGHAQRLRASLEEDLGWEAGSPGMAELGARVFHPEAARPADFEVSAADFALFLQRVLADAGSVPLGGEGGGVQVLDVLEARARTFDAVFAVGLNRDVFPRVVTEDPLLPDGLRRRLRALLPDLPVKTEGRDEERFLFAQLVSSGRSVTLSCAVTDDDGKPRPASPLLESLRLGRRVAAPEPAPALLSARSLAHRRGTPAPLRPAHEHAQLAGLHGTRSQFGRALRVALEEAACSARSERDGSDLERLARARLAVLSELEPGARGRLRLGPFFGFVGAPREAADPRRAPLYVTTAEDAAACPWQTFLQRLLRIEPSPDPLQALPGADARVVGSLVHAVLEGVVSRRLGSRRPALDQVVSREPVAVCWPDAVELEALLRERAEATEREEGIALPGFARTLASVARARLEVAREIDWPSAGTEVPVLGAEVRGSVAVTDDRSVDRVLYFKADRVDRVGSGLRLIDYKTGRPAADQKKEDSRRKKHLERIARGLSLQVPAYARAGRDAGDPGAEGRYHYLHPDGPEHARVFAARADDGASMERFEAAVGAVFSAWEAGSFFPRLEEPGKDEEPRRCASCGVKSACLRGDSGARTRLVSWVEERGSGAAERVPAERALVRLWMLGVESR